MRIKPGDVVMVQQSKFWPAHSEAVIVLTVHMGGHQYDRSLQAECLDSSGAVLVVDCHQLVVVGSAKEEDAYENW